MCIVCMLDGATGTDQSTGDAGASPVEAVQGSDSWANGSAVNLNVYLGNQGDAIAYGAAGTTGEEDWTADEIAAIQGAFEDISEFIDVTFTFVTEYDDSHLAIVKNDDSSYLGYAYGPSSNGTQGSVHGDIVMNHTIGRFFEQGGRWEEGGMQGGQGYETLVHEIGHALGLGHTHDTSLGTSVLLGNTSAWSTGPDGLNDPINSIMAYRDGWVANGTSKIDHGNRGTFGAWDIAALQNMYGANTSFASGDDVYYLPSENGEGTFFSTLWDTGGTDTISGINSTGGVNIDLRAATLDYDPETSGGPVSYGYDADGNLVVGGFTIAGGVGIENAIGSNHDDTIIGNALDNLIYGKKGNDYIAGGAGNDDLRGNKGNDILYGGEGDDSLRGGKNDDFLDGGIGNDLLRGDTGNDELYGGLGDDRLNGGQGDDLLFGGAGDDRISGHKGDDDLTGGSGADIFYMKAGWGQDVITDFEDGVDQIHLRKYDGLTDFSDLDLVQVGDDVVINLLNGDSLTLLDTDLAVVDSGDFIM